MKYKTHKEQNLLITQFKTILDRISSDSLLVTLLVPHAYTVIRHFSMMRGEKLLKLRAFHLETKGSDFGDLEIFF